MDRIAAAYLKFAARRLEMVRRLYGPTHPETLRATLRLADLRAEVERRDAMREAA